MKLLIFLIFCCCTQTVFAQTNSSPFTGKAHVKIKSNKCVKEADFTASTLLNDNNYMNVRGDHYFNIKMFGKAFETTSNGAIRKDAQELRIISDDDANEFDMIGADRTDDMINQYPEFNIEMGDGFSVQKNNGDVIHFIIQKITNEDLVLSFSATMGFSQVEGNVQLHRTKTNDLKTNGIIGCTCDSIAHNKIVGADYRTASQCEVFYHNALGKIVNKAFAPIKPSSEYKADYDNAQNTDWLYENWPEEFVLNGNMIQTNLHKIIFNDYFSFKIRQNFNAPLDEKIMNDILIKVDAEAKPMFKDAPEKYTDELRLQLAQGYTSDFKELDISVGINTASNGDCVFIGPYKTLQIPSATIAYQSSKVVLGHGGGLHPVTIVYLGKWGKPEINPQEKWDEGMATPVVIPSTLPKAAPKLALYNITIIFKGAPITVNKFIDKIDWSVFTNALKNQLPCEN
jgi:hypothetical protein